MNHAYDPTTQVHPSDGTALAVHPGPRLLERRRPTAPSLDVHRATVGPLPDLSLDELLDLLRGANVRGRGGAGFPFGTKLEAASAASGGAREVVVNVSEGEPASLKDAALALTRPHLVLDGAVLTARVLGTRADPPGAAG